MPLDYTVQTCPLCKQAYKKWHECPGPPQEEKKEEVKDTKKRGS